MKAKIIYNPTSGRELFQFKLSNLVVRLSKEGYRVETYPTKAVGDATIAASVACDENVDLIVVSGGDGTLNEVINGVASYETRPKIAYIPSGTTNDFARSLEIPLDIDDAINVLFDGEVRKIDIGKIKDKYFVYSASFGAFTKLTYSTPSKLKTALGHLAYFVNGVTELHKTANPLNVSYIVNGEKFEEEVVLLIIVNSRGIAGLKTVFPEAKLNDGVFDVIMFKNRNNFKINDFLYSLVNGVVEEYDTNGGAHLTVSEITINSDDRIVWNLDGERGEEGGAHVVCLQEHIEIIVPVESKVFI